MGTERYNPNVIFARIAALEADFVRRGATLLIARDAATLENGTAAVRAARLCATHGLNPDAATIERLRAARLGTPPEQAADLREMLLAPHAPTGVRVLEQTGWLAVHAPELEACRTVEPFGFHHVNVLEHSILALEVLLELFPNASLETRAATLLHDIGKPACKIWDARREHWSFFGHDDAGALLSAALLERFGCAPEFKERVALMVGRHMIRLPGDPASAARFVRRQRALLPDLLELMLADREAARGASSSAEARRQYQQGFDRVLEAMRVHDAPKTLLRGEDVMAVLGLEPGKSVGSALEYVRMLQDAGELHDTDGAKAALLEWARVRGLRQGGGASRSNPT